MSKYAKHSLKRCRQTMKRPTPYKEAFPVGTAVHVADREFLDDFVVTWKSGFGNRSGECPGRKRAG